jgi:selenide,water dikinase
MSDHVRALVCDPQTSGGLLIAVRAEGVNEVQALLAEHHWYAEPIGTLSKHIADTPWIQVHTEIAVHA